LAEVLFPAWIQIIDTYRILSDSGHRKLEILRILSEGHGNRRKRFALRINLIAAIYNPELKNAY
jgi:hypothetical protein